MQCFWLLFCFLLLLLAWTLGLTTQKSQCTHCMAAICVSKCLARVLLKKPLSVINAETQAGKLKRHLSLVDLLSIGIGGTVGSGVFVLSGLIARNYAGIATHLFRATTYYKDRALMTVYFVCEGLPAVCLLVLQAHVFFSPGFSLVSAVYFLLCHMQSLQLY